VQEYLDGIDDNELDVSEEQERDGNWGIEADTGEERGGFDEPVLYIRGYTGLVNNAAPFLSSYKV
jgi:hypothetical protein